jgi:hypothetical protein
VIEKHRAEQLQGKIGSARIQSRYAELKAKQQ